LGIAGQYDKAMNQQEFKTLVGSLTAQSEGPERGATFAVKIHRLPTQ